MSPLTHVLKLITNMIVLSNGALKGSLNHKGRAFMGVSMVLIAECKRVGSSWRQQSGPHHKLNILTLWACTSQFPNAIYKFSSSAFSKN